MDYPRACFHDDLAGQADYLCYLAKQIACDYYQDRRFLVLPRLAEKETRAVYFPDLPYPPEFWGCFANYKQSDYIFRFPAKPLALARELLARGPFSRPGLEKAASKAWRAYEKEFFSALADFIPTFPLSRIGKIRVLTSPFGTVGSLFFTRRGRKYDLELTLRADFGPAQIAETILTALFHLETTDMDLPGWMHKEAIVDFLLSRTKLGQIFAFAYFPTLPATPELPDGLITESAQYLAKLGFPVRPILTIEQPGNLAINNKPVYNTFTPTEKRILTGLIRAKNQLASYEQIGNWFWGDSEEALEKFNLASIAKIMEKIRKKIKDAGVYQELIYTARGQGYVVYD